MATQIISLLIFAAVVGGVIFAIRRGRGAAIPNDEGVARLREAFAKIRQDGEAEPHCFVALERKGFSLVQHFVGVTDRRWLVLSAEGQLKEVSRDQYFIHMFHDHAGYEAKLIHADFKGRRWRLHEHMRGYPQQRRELKAMFDRVGYRWVT